MFRMVYPLGLSINKSVAHAEHWVYDWDASCYETKYMAYDVNISKIQNLIYSLKHEKETGSSYSLNLNFSGKKVR